MNDMLTVLLTLIQGSYQHHLNKALELAIQEQMDDDLDQYWDDQDTYTPMLTIVEDDDDEWDDYTWEPMSTNHTKPYWMRSHAA